LYRCPFTYTVYRAPIYKCLQVLAEWCKQTDALLAESEAGTATPLNDESGPDTELEFWRVRMAKFNSVTEQMKSKECRLVMGVCSTARSKQYKRWKEVDIKVHCSGVVAEILVAVYGGIRPCLDIRQQLSEQLYLLLCDISIALKQSVIQNFVS